MARKMKFDINKLIELDLIRRIPKAKQKAQESIKTSKDWLQEAKNNFESQSFRSCMLSCYLAMFHSARSILFINGFREKSHFAVARFLEDKYTRKGLLEEKWIKLLDHYREARHDDQYSTSFFITREESERALEFTKQFVEKMKELLETIK